MVYSVFVVTNGTNNTNVFGNSSMFVGTYHTIQEIDTDKVLLSALQISADPEQIDAYSDEEHLRMINLFCTLDKEDKIYFIENAGNYMYWGLLSNTCFDDRYALTGVKIIKHKEDEIVDFTTNDDDFYIDFDYNICEFAVMMNLHIHARSGKVAKFLAYGKRRKTR